MVVIMMNEEMVEVLVDVWEERADTYERVGCEDEAYQVRLCLQELQQWVADE